MSPWIRVGSRSMYMADTGLRLSAGTGRAGGGGRNGAQCFSCCTQNERYSNAVNCFSDEKAKV